jgi:hypothetical protein
MCRILREISVALQPEKKKFREGALERGHEEEEEEDTIKMFEHLGLLQNFRKQCDQPCCSITCLLACFSL